MIVPFLFAIKKYWKQGILTWTIVFINLFLFFAVKDPLWMRDQKIEEIISDQLFVMTHNQLYFQYLMTVKSQNSRELKSLFLQNNIETDWNIFVAGLNDKNFLDLMLNVAYGSQFKVDRISFLRWQKQMELLKEQFQYKIASSLGVRVGDRPWSQYITYQFVHSTFFHLFSNMIMLVLFGLLLESWIDLRLYAFIYISGGVAGALTQEWIQGLSITPLVGASGAISALMGFYLGYERRKNIPYFYMFAFQEPYLGKIWASKWWLLSLVFLKDLESYLSEPSYKQSVAYLCHMGAALFGFACGILHSTNARFAKSLRNSESDSRESTAP